MSNRKKKVNLFSELEKYTAQYKPVIQLSKKQLENIHTIAGYTLALFAGAGMVALAAVAPNAFQALDKIRKLSKNSKRYSFKEKQKKLFQTFYYLKRRGYIEISSTNKGLIAKITKKGEVKIRELDFDTMQIPKNKWDGKWWLVAADIPTREYRWAADLFRKKVKQLGFYPLQRTLWVYPYNPVEQINFISRHFNISKFITAMQVCEFDREDEQKLKRHFSL